MLAVSKYSTSRWYAALVAPAAANPPLPIGGKLPLPVVSPP
jgi:hypothetical protein